MHHMRWIVTLTHRTDRRPRPAGYWAGPHADPSPISWGPEVVRFATAEAAHTAASLFIPRGLRWSAIPEVEGCGLEHPAH